MTCYHSAALEAGFKESDRSCYLLSLLGEKPHHTPFKVLADLKFIKSPACHSSVIENSVKLCFFF